MATTDKTNEQNDMSKQSKSQSQTLLIKEVCAIDNANLSDKLKISPIGKVTGIDGRFFDIDAQKVLEQTQSLELEIVLNVAHGWSAKYGEDAAGWFKFKDLEQREDGIYATLELNELGKELIESKKYKYLSPEYFVDNQKGVEIIVGVGLVNQPNLLNDSLNNQNPTQTPEELPMSEELQKQVNTLQQEKTDLTTEVNNLTTQNQKLMQQLNEQRIDNAIAQGELAPAKKDFALTLEGNQLDAYLESEKQSFKGTQDNNINPDEDDKDPDANSPVFNQLGL